MIPESTRATVTETVPLESVSEPPPRKRSTPITEPRSSTRTEVFESPMPSDTAGNSTHVLSTDLPSDTSKSESSETPGLQKEMLHLQKTPDRRMAKTVDLRELKKQLSGKIKGDKKAVERSIASTIRACDRDDEIGRLPNFLNRQAGKSVRTDRTTNQVNHRQLESG